MGAKDKKEIGDSSRLQEEVTAYASQLGLGQAQDFAYDDFNPSSAGKAISPGRQPKGGAVPDANLHASVGAWEEL